MSWPENGGNAGYLALRKMSGENCILLNDLIKSNKTTGDDSEECLELPKRTNEDGSLRLPPMKEVIEGKAPVKKEKGEALQLPKMDYTKGGKK